MSDIEYCVSIQIGAQRAEIMKSAIPTQTAATNFAQGFHKAQEERVEKEGGVVPIVRVWRLVDEF